MNLRTVNRAIAAYQAATSPAAVAKALRTLSRHGNGGLITAAGIRSGAADELREVIQKELSK